LSGPVAADTLVSYDDWQHGCANTSGATCFQASGINASNAVGVGPGHYDPYNTTSVDYGTGLLFSFTATSAGHLDSMSFYHDNNDCEFDGFVFCSNPTQWEVLESVNGGGWTDVFNFSAGSPYTQHNEGFGLNQDFSAGDTIAFEIVLTGFGPDFHVSTANYNTSDIIVSGSTSPVPEPTSLLLLGSGLLAVVRKFKK
jgi:hypothetical protein